MLNKLEIIQRLKALELDPEQYCVMTGAAMVLHGIKQETQDIDIGCTEVLYEALLKRGHKTKKEKNYQCIILDDDVEIFGNWLPAQRVYIEGLPVAGIDCIKDYKMLKAREKDLRDIELIEGFMKNQK